MYVSVAGTTALIEKWNGQCIAVEDSGYYHAIERAVRNNKHDINTNHKQELTKKGSKPSTTQKLPEPHGKVTTPYEGSKPVNTKPLKSTLKSIQHANASTPPPTLKGGECREPEMMTVITGREAKAAKKPRSQRGSTFKQNWGNQCTKEGTLPRSKWWTQQADKWGLLLKLASQHDSQLRSHV